jgi:hypothetical protein
MKKQKIVFYVFRWLALIFLTFLIIKGDHSEIMMLVLIGFVSAILIREGIRDFN